MDLDLDDYVDPYEEAEAEAAAAEDGSDDPDEDDSDAESDYEEESFGLLKSGKHRVRNPDGTFRCPFCPGKKKQGYKIKDLLQHADGIGVSSKHRRHGRERANHRAFARFVRTEPSFAEDLVGITGIQGAIKPTPANRDGSTNGDGKAKANVDTAGSSSVAAKVGLPREVERFSWPWACVLAAGAGFNTEDFAGRVAMFSSVEVVPLFVDEVEVAETFAVVRFTNDWSGFSDALTLENHFSINKLGKKEFEMRDNGIGSVEGDGGEGEVKVYGWVARAEDYDSPSVVGRFLRKHTVLKTIDEVSKTELEKSGEMVAILASKIEEKNRHLQDLETKKNATELSISRLEEDNRKLHEAYNEEMRNLHRRARENALRIFQENENLRIDLESKKRELNLRAKELDKISTENANDRKTLDNEKQKAKYDNSELELASIEQQRADADVLKLLADQEREKEDVLARMLQLEKELHEKQQLELEVERLNGTLQVMKHLEGDDDGGDIHEKMEKLSERFEREKKRLEELSGDLVRKERESNDELQEARKELIKGLEEELNGRTAIGVKRMGELDEKPFQNACKTKYGKDEYEIKAAELVTSWQDELKKPSWHPFKMVEVNGENKEILDDDDTKLKFLWIEYGDDVCNAVKTALMEINEYNPSGRYVVPELWNFRKGRKATVKEVLKYLFSQMDTTTKRRRG
ncbi:factor of DNA methylation 1 [Zea mays]|uniref:Putative XH domain family protein n=1 Tax=Zea mays TaxID=4577 RepID=K7UYM2_MAIZE|nr:factor of DNA methylation 1 [Zea mays]AQK90295.1 Putative XH domain family protein [Zea mays]AQK90296.1 Putative XH domain family protein [Zea mays]AQK90300.1 Putative XH domain family protein [Zea mays]AQK90303.1 Putative XH domain family protein [Zea mays]|eukprot:XP_008655632.1 factor of DNA methylation 1 [Zea mays]